MHETDETLRKALHIGFGLFAVTLAWLPWWAAALIAAAAVAGNWLLLHRVVGRGVWRGADRVDRGIVLYPAMVCLLIIVFRDQPVVAGTAWAILAFGDGFATLAGRAIGGPRLPWNADKRWSGLAAFLTFGFAGSLPIFRWLQRDATLWSPWLIVGIAVVVAGVVESLPLRIDDNITVPWTAAFLIAPMLQFHHLAELDLTREASMWIVANSVLAAAGYLARSVDASGMIGGWMLGIVLILCGGWPLYAALLAFFIIGTAGTKLGYRVKAAEGIAQEKGGRRGFRHAFANVGVASAIALWMSFTGHSDLLFLAALASLATAAADTAGSEFGQVFGRTAFLPLTFRRVPRGTEGAVSIEGTLCSVVAAFVVATVGIAAASRYSYVEVLHGGLWSTPWMRVAVVAVVAIIAAYLESIAGSWNRRAGAGVPGDVMNFLNTLTGALLLLLLASV